MRPRDQSLPVTMHKTSPLSPECDGFPEEEVVSCAIALANPRYRLSLMPLQTMSGRFVNGLRLITGVVRIARRDDQIIGVPKKGSSVRDEQEWRLSRQAQIFRLVDVDDRYELVSVRAVRHLCTLKR